MMMILVGSLYMVSSCINQSQYIYLSDNGTTIKVIDKVVVVGEWYEFNGVSYSIVDNNMLWKMISDGSDITMVGTI